MAHVKYKWRIASFIFKAICSVFIAAVVLFLLWRIIDNANDPASMNTVIPNSALCEAYDENGGKLTMFSQEQTTYTRGEKNSWYFAVTQSLFITEADQLQFVLRYNNSTLKYTISAIRDRPIIKGLSRRNHLFIFSLLCLIILFYSTSPSCRNQQNFPRTKSAEPSTGFPCIPKSSALSYP